MPWSVDDKASSFETPRSKCDTLRGAAPCYPGRACGGGLHICKAICSVSMSGTVLRTPYMVQHCLHDGEGAAAGGRPTAA